MKEFTCRDKPLSCGMCDNHICLEEADGNYIGLRVAQMAIMQGMTENMDNPDIIAGLDVALAKVSERITRREGNSG